MTKILVVLTGSLGDLVRGLAIAEAIKSQKSDYHITWIVDDKWQDIIKSHQFVDEVIIFKRKQGISGIIQLYRELKQNNFDYCLDLQRIFKSGLFSWFSRAKTRIGFNPKNCKEFNYIFNNSYIREFDELHNKLDIYLEFVKALGLEETKTINFGLNNNDQSALSKICNQLKPKQYLVLIMGSSWETKNWTETGYLELVKKLLCSYQYRIVLLGDPSQKQFAESVYSQIGQKEVINLTGKTKLGDLLPLLEFAKIVIGPDSGPGHISAAYKTPYISLFGPTPSERVAPYGFEDLVIVADVDCRPCSLKICPGFNQVCMRNISAKKVFNCTKELLNRV